MEENRKRPILYNVAATCGCGYTEKIDQSGSGMGLLSVFDKVKSHIQATGHCMDIHGTIRPEEVNNVRTQQQTPSSVKQ